jgi:hypothetical protein
MLGKVGDTVKEPFAFLKKGLARVIVRIELGLSVRARFEVQVRRFEKLAKNYGRGGTLKLVGGAGEAGRGARGAPNGAFASIYGKTHALGSDGCSSEGISNVLRFNETRDVVDVGQSMTRPITGGSETVEFINDGGTSKSEEEGGEEAALTQASSLLEPDGFRVGH